VLIQLQHGQQYGILLGLVTVILLLIQYSQH
jgi:hypothetical protein